MSAFGIVYCQEVNPEFKSICEMSARSGKQLCRDLFHCCSLTDNFGLSSCESTAKVAFAAGRFAPPPPLPGADRSFSFPVLVITVPVLLLLSPIFKGIFISRIAWSWLVTVIPFPFDKRFYLSGPFRLYCSCLGHAQLSEIDSVHSRVCRLSSHFSVHYW